MGSSFIMNEYSFCDLLACYILYSIFCRPHKNPKRNLPPRVSREPWLCFTTTMMDKDNTRESFVITSLQ
jgi:hypothetical protein